MDLSCHNYPPLTLYNSKLLRKNSVLAQLYKSFVLRLKMLKSIIFNPCFFKSHHLHGKTQMSTIFAQSRYFTVFSTIYITNLAYFFPFSVRNTFTKWIRSTKLKMSLWHVHFELFLPNWNVRTNFRWLTRNGTNNLQVSLSLANFRNLIIHVSRLI